ncbi:MAG: divalent-cation tolerance protein CutA [Planctomycetota bacterium]|nr:MAG: divalent-cation tolerance protein CutA [Planctomycetota bacterium]REK38722.1 MAG: divalent-cation tolerance protein CutA [Planctomycetota bacterium]
MTKFLQVATTIDSEASAQQLARAVVEARLAACVQVQGPLHSTYRWQGDVETATEWLCTMKTSAAKLPALEAKICEFHSYDVPEIVATEIVAGSAAYLAWLAAELEESEA